MESLSNGAARLGGGALIAPGGLRRVPMALCHLLRRAAVAGCELFHGVQVPDARWFAVTGAGFYRRLHGCGVLCRAAVVAQEDPGIFAATIVLLIPILCLEPTMWSSVENTPIWGVQMQLVFWSVCGISILTLVGCDLKQRRDARAILLALWVLGTFLFAGFVNWTINGRSILPMAPAVGILIARRLDANRVAGWNISKWIPISLVAAGAFALIVTRGDYLYAVACRDSAQQIVVRFCDQKDNLFFQGHWAYQFYMKAGGMKEFDVYNAQLQPGNILANADYNTLVLPPETNANVAKMELFTPPARNFSPP